MAHARRRRSLCDRRDPPGVSRAGKVTPLGACLSNSGFCWSRKGESDSVLGMSKRFRPWKIDEPQLLPASVQDFVAEDHLARFVVSFVAEDHLARFVVSLVTEELNAGGDRSRSNSIHQCVDRALT